MAVSKDRNLGILDSDTTIANFAVVLADDRTALVDLAPDHPGFTDPVYRARRNSFAQIAVNYEPVAVVPDATYEQHMHQAERRPFDLQAMEQQDYDVTRYQPVLFCAESFSEMDRRLRE